MKPLLTAAGIFTSFAGVWLGVMENVLKHDGYTGRVAIAACIVSVALIFQGLATWIAMTPRLLERGHRHHA